MVIVAPADSCRSHNHKSPQNRHKGGYTLSIGHKGRGTNNYTQHITSAFTLFFGNPHKNHKEPRGKCNHNIFPAKQISKKALVLAHARPNPQPMSRGLDNQIKLDYINDKNIYQFYTYRQWQQYRLQQYQEQQEINEALHQRYRRRVEYKAIRTYCRASTPEKKRCG